MGAATPRPRPQGRLVAFAVLAALAPAMLAAAPAAAGEVYGEGWEADGWTLAGPGASKNCHIASTGSCSLLLQPDAGAAASAASGPLHLRDPWGGEVTFAFRAQTDRALTDAVVEILFDHGALRYHLAAAREWGDVRRDDLTYVESEGHGAAQGLPWTPGAWHVAGFRFTPSGGVRGLLDGRAFGHLHLPEGANVITGIRIVASTPQEAAPGAFHVDDVRIALRPPEAPVAFRASAEDTAEHVHLSWTPPTSSPAIAGLRLTREGGAHPPVERTLAPDATSFAEDGLGACTTYRYRIASFGPSGEGAPAQLTFTTLGCPERPARVEAVPLGGGQGVVVTWVQPPHDARTGAPADRWRVLRAEAGGPEVEVALVAEPHHRDLDVRDSTAYRYRVVALHANGESAPSDAADATTPDPYPDVVLILEDLGVGPGTLP